jgi:hypothetical protein
MYVILFDLEVFVIIETRIGILMSMSIKSRRSKKLHLK